MSRRCDYDGPGSCGQLIQDDADACYLHLDDYRASAVARRAQRLGERSHQASDAERHAQKIRVPKLSQITEEQMTASSLREIGGLSSATASAVYSAMQAITNTDDLDEAMHQLSVPSNAARSVQDNSFALFADELEQQTGEQVSRFGLSGMHRMKRNGLFFHDNERTHAIAVLSEQEIVIDPYASLLAPVADPHVPAHEQAEGWRNPLFLTPLCTEPSFYRTPYSYIWFDSCFPID